MFVPLCYVVCLTVALQGAMGAATFLAMLTNRVAGDIRDSLLARLAKRANAVGKASLVEASAL